MPPTSPSPIRWAAGSRGCLLEDYLAESEHQAGTSRRRQARGASSHETHTSSHGKRGLSRLFLGVPSRRVPSPGSRLPLPLRGRRSARFGASAPTRRRARGQPPHDAGIPCGGLTIPNRPTATPRAWHGRSRAGPAALKSTRPLVGKRPRDCSGPLPPLRRQRRHSLWPRNGWRSRPSSWRYTLRRRDRPFAERRTPSDG